MALIWLLPIAGVVFITLSQMSYWLLACRYWELSYTLEELIMPVGFIPQPDYHKWVKSGMVVWICFWPIMTVIFYLLVNIKHIVG